MPDKKGPPPHDPKVTLLIVVCCLVLSVPFAGLAINLESTPNPDPRTADPSTIIQGPHIALYAAAATFIATAVFSSLGSTMLRHSSPNNAVIAMITFGGAGVNFAIQLIALAVIYVTVFTKPMTNDIRLVQFINNQYQTNGRQFTRETWACMMSNLYLRQEPWSTNACSEYHYARYLTIIMVVNSFLMICVVFWPVRSTLFGRNKQRPSKA